MEGIERLEQEALEMNNHNVILIFDYIKNKHELQNKFNNKNKTIKGMYDYICNQAKKIATQNVAMVNDKIVYLWAITYFNKSNDEIGPDKKCVSTKAETSKIPQEKQSSNQFSLFEEVQK